MMIILIWVGVVIAALWLYFKNIYSSFERRGVKYLKPVPVLGNMTRLLLRIDHFADDIDKLYWRFPEERFVGRYEFMNEVTMIRDIELVKKVAVKDFEYFLDHRTMADDRHDNLFGRNLFSLKGQEWKDMRSTLSPAFTSSKMKMMVPFMVEVGNQMTKALKNKLEASGAEYLNVDCKDLTSRYANDVIASCAFGLKVDSHNDENNDFYEMGKTAATFKFRQFLMFFFMACFPRITKLVNFQLFSETVKKFFRNLVLNTMQDRETRHIVRPDMIHLLMEAKKGRLTHDEKASNDNDAGFATVEESNVGRKAVTRTWSNDDLVAQAVLFFIAGFETISSGMSFLLYELAVNPDIQEKLVEEIRENDAKTCGKFDYNTIQNLPYMDMVVSELLRLWPPAVATDRMCNKDYNLGKPNSDAKEDVIVQKGKAIMIPIWAIHHDSNYFPDPLKFDPERFSEQNKHNIKPFTYMPFGLGPRNCIGSRFALCELKILAYQVLQHFEVSPNEKTTIPATLSKDNFNIRLEGGHWLNFKIRN